jgi:YVTN family beta-propeller protein
VDISQPRGDEGFREVEDSLRDLVREYGRAVTRDPARFRSVLNDISAGWPRQRGALEAAVDAGVMAELDDRSDLGEHDVAALASRVAHPDGRWAVQALARACEIPVRVGPFNPGLGFGGQTPPPTDSQTTRAPVQPAPPRQAGKPAVKPPASIGPVPINGVTVTVAAAILLVLLILGYFVLPNTPTSTTDATASPARATGTPTVLTTIPVEPGPARVAVSPDGRRLYVTTHGYAGSLGGVTVIDTATNTVITHIRAGHLPSGVAFTPDGRHVYVTDVYANPNLDPGNSVLVIDTATNTVTATITVGAGPVGVAIPPDGGRAYIANFKAHTVSVIDTATATVTASIPLEAAPSSVAVTPDGRYAYAPVGDLPVIDTGSNTVTRTISMGSIDELGYEAAVAPDGRHAFVTVRNGADQPGFIAVVDTATNAVTSTIPVGVNPAAVAVSPDGQHAYVTNGGTASAPGNTVSVIDIATNSASTTLNICGTGPAGIAVSPDGRRAYSANFESNSVTVIDTGIGTGLRTPPNPPPAGADSCH